MNPIDTVCEELSAELARDIPNTVYTLVTITRTPELRAHFDLGLMDAYGRHSGQSRYFCVCLALHVPDTEMKRGLRAAYLQAVPLLQEAIRAGQSVKLHEITETVHAVVE